MKTIKTLGGTILIIITAAITSCNKGEKPWLITMDVTSITSSSAICGGEIFDSGSEEIIARGVCWSIDKNPTNEGDTTLDGSGTGRFLSNITGLNDGTAYFLRAYATNSVGTSYGEEKMFRTVSTAGQIIADHTVVDRYDDIPPYYLDQVKKMLVYISGRSHSEAYNGGLALLESANPAYAVNLGEGESYTTSYLRCNINPNNTPIYTDVWFSWLAWPEGSRPVASKWITNLIQEYHDAGHPFTVLTYGWCWELIGGYPSASKDQEYNFRWMGYAVGTPINDNYPMGLDAGDKVYTQNDVCMDTYLNAIEYYRNYCKTHDINTEVIFTTGPTSGAIAEAAYQTHIKNEYIRDFVLADPTRILLDYADILAYDNNRLPTTGTYDGHTYPFITPANELPDAGYHISAVGALRLGKATWWLLARLAGWDGK